MDGEESGIGSASSELDAVEDEKMDAILTEIQDLLNEIPEPVVNEIPDPVVNEIPDPVVNAIPDPVMNEIPDPVVSEASGSVGVPGPVMDGEESGIPSASSELDAEEDEKIDAILTEIQDDGVNEIPESVVNEISDLVVNEASGSVGVPGPVMNKGFINEEGEESSDDDDDDEAVANPLLMSSDTARSRQPHTETAWLKKKRKIPRTKTARTGVAHILEFSKVGNVPDDLEENRMPVHERRNLLKFFKELDERNCVLFSISAHKAIKCDVEKLAEMILNGIGRHDSRFKSRLVRTGSFYDDLKVCQPDEFDFLAELESLSDGVCSFVPTDEPGFVYCTVDPSKKEWDDMSEMLCRLHKSRTETWCRKCSDLPPPSVKPFGSNFHLVGNDHPGAAHLMKILSPDKVQKRFREVLDGTMQDDMFEKLIEGWDGGGFNRPFYSGYRRHGPATLLQFVHVTGDTELKVNLDITLAVKMPLPLDHSHLGFHIMKLLDPTSRTYKQILKALKYGPGIHLIPLYSKLMLAKQRYSEKHTWRVSCNLIESLLLGRWAATSVPKMLLRILKTIKSKYLTDGKRPTCRPRRDQGTGERGSRGGRGRGGRGRGGRGRGVRGRGGRGRGSGSGGFRRGGHSRGSNKSGTRGRADVDDTEPKRSLDEAEHVIPVETSQASVNESPNTFSTGLREDTQESCSEDTDIDEKSLNEAMKHYKQYADVFQMNEAEILQPLPGIGEYYGPRDTLTSIEFKTIMLRLLKRHPDMDFWTEDKIPDMVLGIFRMFHVMFIKKQTMTNFFFHTFVCTPCNPEKRERALVLLNALFKRLDEIAKLGDAAWSLGDTERYLAPHLESTRL